MPTPIAHGVVGLAVARTLAPGKWPGAGAALAVSAVAVLPDLDFLAGFLVGSPHRFHRGPTHSLVGAGILALLIIPVLKRAGVSDPRPAEPHGNTAKAAHFSQMPAGSLFRGYALAWCLGFMVLLSHLIADAIMPDPGGGVGVPFLWPFTGRDYSATVPLPPFLANALEIRFDGPTSWFLATLLSPRTWLVFLLEGLLFSPLLVIPWAIRGARRWLAREPQGETEPDQGKIPRSR
jgi:membrane-bound metal-dependent hydrolase YbcI (DUF457 family)